MGQAGVMVRLVMTVAGVVATAAAVAWAAGAWVHFPLVPAWVRWAAGVAVLVTVAAAAWQRPAWGVAVAWVAAGVVAAAWSLKRPAAERSWSPDQERVPGARWVSADVVEIVNVRHATYRAADDFDVRWETRRYDLRELRQVDTIVEPFGGVEGPAHAMLSFGFSDGRWVAVSFEVRREVGEAFDPLAGIFREFEAAYVIGDERDLLGLRANVRRNPVRVHPTRATPAQARAMLESVLAEVAELERRPAFYNTLVRNCATTVARHAGAALGRRLPWDWRMVLPVHFEAVAWSRGWLAGEGSLEAVRERHLVNARAAFRPVEEADPEGVAWSRQIREGRAVPAGG